MWREFCEWRSRSSCTSASIFVNVSRASAQYASGQAQCAGQAPALQIRSGITAAMQPQCRDSLKAVAIRWDSEAKAEGVTH